MGFQSDILQLANQARESRSLPPQPKTPQAAFSGVPRSEDGSETPRVGGGGILSRQAVFDRWVLHAEQSVKKGRYGRGVLEYTQALNIDPLAREVLLARS
eukprot:tig00000383_g24728.t1